jgi:hypothetical protein
MWACIFLNLLIAFIVFNHEYEVTVNNQSTELTLHVEPAIPCFACILSGDSVFQFIVLVE